MGVSLRKCPGEKLGRRFELDKGLCTTGEEPEDPKIDRNTTGWHKFVCSESNSKNCNAKQLKTPQEKYLAFREPQDYYNKTNATC